MYYPDLSSTSKLSGKKRREPQSNRRGSQRITEQLRDPPRPLREELRVST